MKLRLVAIAALLPSSTSAFTADLAPRAVEPAALLSPAFNWSGFYAGVHVGAVLGDSEATDSTGALSSSKTGFIGGVHAGYNLQFDNNVVFGFEGDTDYTGLSMTENDGFEGFEVATKLKRNWQASVRARAGYAFGNLLPYVTGGAAFADQKFGVAGGNGTISFAFSSSKTIVGWTAGGGLEYAVDQNWIVRGEARYTDFGKTHHMMGEVPTDVRYNETAATLGVSYKF